MTISATDIKLRQSQRLTDNDDGGGRMVATQIVDGQMNNLFPDIGDEERTTGRTTLRKMFVHVDTPTVDVLKDAIGVIVNPPTDSQVSMAMFATGSYSDVRSDARDVVERYVTKGVESRFVLLGNHFTGQQAASFYCMPDAPTPDVNDNLCLSTTGAGYPQVEQYIRVKSVLSRTTQSFFDESGQFDRDVVIIELVTALLYDFYGQEPNRYTSSKPPTRVYSTNTVESANYYSVKRTTAAAEVGDLSVQLGTPYVQIVPATTAETPVVDQLAGLGSISYVRAGAVGSLSTSYSESFSPGEPVTRYLGNPLVRGSVSVTTDGVTLTDDGDGNLSSPAVSPWAGSVDYQTGAVSVTHTTGTSSAISISATPAGPIATQGFTRKVDITLANQGYNFVLQLQPLPAPGTIVVDYRALGRWIRLTDNGTGQLTGNPGQGGGSINYATGSVIVTLGALPDLNSSLLSSWGTGVIADRRDGDTNIQVPALDFLLAHEGVVPGSLTIKFRVNNADVVATDNGAGVLMLGGAARGSVVYSSGQVTLRPPTLPDAGSGLLCEYAWGAQTSASVTPLPDSSGIVSFTVANVPVSAGSLRLEWLDTITPMDPDLGSVSVAARMIAQDDGQGNIKLVSVGSRAQTDTIGTISYASGSVSVKVGNIAVQNFPMPTYSDYGGVYRYQGTTRMAATATYSGGTQISVQSQLAGSASTAASDTLALPAVSLDLTPTVMDAIVPGSVRFDFRGRTYVDRSGALYFGVDPVTGAGTFAGSIDYAGGLATITQWAAGGSNAVTVTSLLTQIFDPGTDAVFFRTTGAPLRSGSFTVRATTLGGVQVVGTTDVNGAITGDFMAGSVDWETGVVDLRFGRYVLAADNESEPWYDPDKVVGNQVWMPMLMLPSSIYFGAVVYRSIPLSSVVIGLDSIRLPSDGRVPAYKSGQTVLIHHTQAHSVPAPAPGQVVNFGRGRVAQLEVRDSAGTPVLSAWYTYDLDVGKLTFSDPLNLTGYTLPIVISERIEDRRLVAAVQITGEIQLNSGLTHDFPIGETLVSTALRLGEANGSLDLQARVQNLFDQDTWINVWTDVVNGAAAPATYNDTDYPISVKNADAITERWVIRFTNATQFEVSGETVGTILTGATTEDCAPINARTGLPYFVIDRDGWGTGWATNNAVRFNTIGALAPVWMARTTLPGTPETAVDSFRFQVIGNVAEST
jgi:hypothetical protein